MQSNALQACLAHAKHLAIAAGQAIMPYYANPNRLNIREKVDHSPVTAADLAAHQLIIDGLNRECPDIPVLSEEAANIPFATRKQWRRYWLIDPLDGTREFLKGNGEFTVNIALIENHQPILGVVYSPVFDDLYWASTRSAPYKQHGSSIKRLHVKPTNINQLTIAASRSHGQKNLPKFTKQLENFELITLGSSLKTCIVAEGHADIYPRFGPTSEWDTAAAHCILNAAGGKIIDVSGAELRYNTQASLLNPWFLAVGDADIDWLALLPDEFKEEL